MNTEHAHAEFEAWLYRTQTQYEPDDLNKREVEIAMLAFIEGRAALQSQDREDAERYRRLRNGDIDDVEVVRGLDAMDYGSSAVIATYSECIDGDDLDSVIDRARRSEKGKK